MILIFNSNLLWLLALFGCGAWAIIVANRKYSNVAPQLLHEIIGGLLIITLLTIIGGVIAVYLSKPIPTDTKNRIGASFP